MNSRASIYRAQNTHHFAVAKGFMQRRRVSTQQCRDFRCCVPKSGQKATQRCRTLRCYGPERYTAKNVMLAKQRRRVLRCCILESMDKGFLLFKTQI